MLVLNMSEAAELQASQVEINMEDDNTTESDEEMEEPKNSRTLVRIMVPFLIFLKQIGQSFRRKVTNL